MPADNTHESMVFRAISCRVLFAGERKAIGIEAINKAGQSLVLELAGDGPAALKAEIERCFAEHPEMAHWKSPTPN